MSIESNIPAAWPYDEAIRIADRLKKTGKTHALFETGYGPSGLPHIGTLSEVLRTVWVKNAFTDLTGLPSKLLAFSDDMDALRRVPDNLPQADMLKAHVGLPLSRIPDPFGTHASFSAHNNARLLAFLDSYGLNYEFASSSDYYARGVFDPTLRLILERHQEIVEVIAPTLGEERQATYSPVLPIHPRTGCVMEVKIDRIDTNAGTVFWQDPVSKERFETSVYGGGCKMQWKADWAMRWCALGVDFEMNGKDLIDSVKLSSRIVKILGAEPPVNMTYELFLDEHGKKISKSKGNGMSVEEWLTFGSNASLAQFIYSNPKAAKPIHRALVPKITDDYLTNLEKARGLEGNVQKANSTWHIHNTNLKGSGLYDPALGSPVTYAMLLNLANVTDASDSSVLWGFLNTYRPDVTKGSYPMLDDMVEKCLEYYRVYVQPLKSLREPTDEERVVFQELVDVLETLPRNADAEAIQFHIYEVGKKHYPTNLRDWFKTLYQVLLGQDEGPRFGHFIRIYGMDQTLDLIKSRLNEKQPVP